MADSKISALQASTTPLAGTEVLPIVQSSATKQVTVANLTAGRAISATQLTLTAGNVIVANGYGIDFSATPGTGTSELLADYEEGTWTGTLTAATPPTTPITATGTYTKVGRLVMYNILFLNVDTTGAAGAASVTGLPFTVGATSEGNVVSNAFANPSSTQTGGGGTTAGIVITQTAGNASLIALTGRFVFITGVYNV